MTKFRLRPELMITPVDMTPEEKRAIDAKALCGFLHRWESKTAGRTKEVKDARDHYHAGLDRLVAKVRLDGAIREILQVDDQNRLLKGFREFDAAMKLAEEGFPEILDSLRFERVSGFADDNEIKTYLRAGILSAWTPTRSERRALVSDEIGQDEVRYQAESKLGEAYRCSFNLLAARLGVSYHWVSKVESESYPDRWQAYETGGEKRLDTNGVPKAKRDRATPSPVQAIANLFGGSSTETLHSLTLDKLEDAYRTVKKSLDPEFTTDSEISKVEGAYEFLRAELERMTPEPVEDRGEGDDRDRGEGEDQGEGDGRDQSEVQDRTEGDDQGEVQDRTEGDDQGEYQIEGEDQGGREDEPEPKPKPDKPSWLTEEAIAELQEEVERFAEERAAVEDYLGAKDRPFTAGLISAFQEAGLIEVDDEGIIRDWSAGNLSDLGGTVASLSLLDSILRDLGVTPEIAQRHIEAMIRESRGYAKQEPQPKPRRRGKSNKTNK